MSAPVPSTHRVDSIRKVMVWIYFRGSQGARVLILKTRPDRGSFWQPVTGKVDSGESLEEGALREAREETSLHFLRPPEPLEYQFDFERPHWTNPERILHVTEVAFAMQAEAGPTGGEPPVILDAHEHVAFEWVDFSEADSRIHFPTNVKALRLLRERLGLA